MLETVSVVDAKRRFSEILRYVGEGKEFIVTSHGRPVAKIIPPGVKTPEARRKAIERIMELRKGHVHGDRSLKEMIDEGRP